MTLAIPASLADITPEWLTGALREGGALKSGRVVAFDREPIAAGVGLLGELQRLSLSYEGANADAPATLIAKAPTQDPGGRGLAMMLGFYEVEERFYRELAAGAPVCTPRCYYGAGDPETVRFVLLLEDLGTLRLGDQLAGMTVDEARIAMEEFARFHARFWDGPDGKQYGWVPGFDHPRFVALEMAYPGASQAYLERFGHRLGQAERDLVAGFGGQFLELARSMQSERMTIAHGDARMDNFFFGSTDGSAPMTIIDWQILAHAPGTYDIGYMLSQSLDVDLRRAHEKELVRAYHDALVANGVEGYPWERCWEDYRKVALYCLVYPVFAGGSVEPANERGVQLVETFAARSFAAIKDLGCREFLTT